MVVAEDKMSSIGTAIFGKILVDFDIQNSPFEVALHHSLLDFCLIRFGLIIDSATGGRTPKASNDGFGTLEVIDWFPILWP